MIFLGYNLFFIMKQKNRISRYKTKRRLFWLMLPVVIPGLIISTFGIVSLSQQQEAKELKLEETYTGKLNQIRADMESAIQDSIERTFRQLTDKLSTVQPPLSNPSSLQLVLKDILLDNPVVKYPFIIDEKGEYIFPLPRKTPIVRSSPTLPVIRDKKLKTLFHTGEALEFKDRKILEALKYYINILNSINALSPRPHIMSHIMNAAARCYFKLGRYPQALSYYRDILTFVGSRPSSYPNARLYFSVLRNTALCYHRMNRKAAAVNHYLLLYEGILHYETAGSENREHFVFYKNEALDFLNRNIKTSTAEADADATSANGPEQQRFLRAKAMDRLQELSELDIELRWRYFEDSGTGKRSPDSSRISSNEASRLSRIREFYLPTDEKSRFYSAVKQIEQWQQAAAAGSTTTFTSASTAPQRKRLSYSFSGFHPVVTYKIINTPGQAGKGFFFGFMISPAVLSSESIENVPGKYLEDSNIRFFIRNNPERRMIKGTTDSLDGYKLLSLPLRTYFRDTTLVLYTDEPNYFARRIRREIRLNRAFIFAFILMFTLGIYLFYKYQSREAELVRLKSDFTDSASHTLKTPLTRIRMLAEKLQLGWVSDESKKQEYLQTILTETDRMSEMISNMLDFSKIEAGRKQYRMDPDPIAPIITEVIESYRQYIVGLGFRLQTEVDHDIPEFRLDRDAVRLIVVNLLLNAVKYSDKEKHIVVRLYVNGSITDTDREDDNVVIEVEDHGIGIKEPDREKIFERFHRSPGSHIQAIEGSGLGLFLVNHAVHAHNGSIEVESQPGKGSLFKIRLPMGKT
jgi:signal transduction histidine kinase